MLTTADSLGENFEIQIVSRQGTARPYKGKSILDLPTDYVVLDIETTGLYGLHESLIEFSGIRIRNGELVDQYSTLINPGCKINWYISELTGLTDEMLESAPTEETAIEQIYNFIGDDIIVGHNVHFDINMLYDKFMRYLEKPCSNNLVDTLRLSRKLFPELPSHRLRDVASALNLQPESYHRADVDVMTTWEIYRKLYEISVAKGENFQKYFLKRNVDLRAVTSDKTNIDISHPFYGKNIVFTGTLERMQRTQAAQLVVDVGGICQNGINKKTNYLILGSNECCSTIVDGKSAKLKKAEALKLAGQDIEIISEFVFYDMIADEAQTE